MRIELVALPVTLLALASACGGAGSDPPPVTATAATAPGSAAVPPVATAPPVPSPFVVTAEGELTTPGDVTFRVRPLAGPGSMGPSEVAPASDAALAHVKKYLDAHPAESVRVECSINVMRTSSGPSSPYAANLANLAARWLVQHGLPCQRVEAVGRLERAPDAPVERIRFLVRWDSAPVDAREDPCSAPRK